jgi:hypothetical protein
VIKFIMWLIQIAADRGVRRLHNHVDDNPHKNKFKIQSALESDFGREVVRMHWTHRRFATRYDIVRITYRDSHIYVPILGLDGAENRGIARIGYDLRVRLGMPRHAKNSAVEFELTIEKAGFFGQLHWYLSTSDPSVKIPAWLAFWSITLSVVSIALTVISLF